MKVERPTEDNPRYDTVPVRVEMNHFQFITTPERLKLLQKAGNEVGLEVHEQRSILSHTGETISIKDGEVGVHYWSLDHDLLDRFERKVAELTKVQQQTQ